MGPSNATSKPVRANPFRRLVAPGFILLALTLLAMNGEGILQQFGLAAVTQTVTVFEYAVKVGLWFSAAFFLNRALAVFFWDGLIAGAIGGPVPRLLKDMMALVLYLIAATGIMGLVFEKPVTGFWATSGVVGIVLGFALRNIILDIFTGIAVSVDRPYRIGDWVMIHEGPLGDDNPIGCVTEVNWRTTRLRLTTNNTLIVPNSIMGQKMVTNLMTPSEESRFELELTLDFSVPTRRAIRVLTAGVRAVTDVPEGPLAQPSPKVRVTAVNELGVVYRMRYWLVPRQVSPAKARNTILGSVLYHLDQAGISLAYPKQDTYWARMPHRQLETKSLADRCQLLSRIALFETLEPDELRPLAEAMAERLFAAGTTLINEGEAGDSMFIAVEGVLDVRVHSAEQQKEIRIARVIPGEFFGEMSLLTGEPRGATVNAATDVVVYEITKEHMREFFNARPELAETISQTIAERRLGTAQALEAALTDEQAASTESTARQILGRMKAFFQGVFGED